MIRSLKPDKANVISSPLFFLGLAAIAVPVLVHLIQRERKRVDRVSRR